MDCSHDLTHELEQIRTEVAAIVLDLPCIIQRKSEEDDPYGSGGGVWRIIATTKAGVEQPSATELQNYASRLGSHSVWHVSLPFGLDVAEGDKLIIDGTEMTVQAVLLPHSFAALTTVLASR